jgi:ABC-type Fe3+ transport system permease subunit
MRTTTRDRSLVAGAVLATVLTCAILAYDIVQAALGHPERGLYVLPLVLTAFVGMLAWLERRGNRAGVNAGRP